MAQVLERAPQVTVPAPVAPASPTYEDQRLPCSVGIMAYNEEANIGRLLQALLTQQTNACSIESIIVLASGCTDGTESIVRKVADRYPKVRLEVQARREGKASAVNLFIALARSDILVMESADTVPEPYTIEALVAPFHDPEIGMTGAHPVPVNDPTTFMGFADHLLWDLHHHVALANPKMGELIAFRRIFQRIPITSAVDEANIEPLVRGQGYEIKYVPEAIVHNRGPSTVHDFLKQRRRIHAGHLRMERDQGYRVATMGTGGILTALRHAWRWEPRFAMWAPAVIGLEAYGRMLGWMDLRLQHRDHQVWEIATSTKAAIE